MRKLATPIQKAVMSEQAQQYAEEALKALVAIATNGKSESARVSAATALLDRGYGRPRQEVTGANGAPVAQLDYTKCTPEQLIALEALLVGMVEDQERRKH